MTNNSLKKRKKKQQKKIKKPIDLFEERVYNIPTFSDEGL